MGGDLWVGLSLERYLKKFVVVELKVEISLGGVWCRKYLDIGIEIRYMEGFLFSLKLGCCFVFK